MNTEKFSAFFDPRSIAVIGASGKRSSLGFMVMQNLMQAGFSGPVMPVNPQYESVCGVLSYATVDELPQVADLAVICAPAAMIPDLIGKLGASGTRAAVVLSAGMEKVPDGAKESLQEQMLAEASRSGMRILGPNCLGLIVPGSGINASFAHTQSLLGSLAFVSQSGALSTAVLDWAKSSGIGFSCFLSLGNSADVTFSDCIEYLAEDEGTSAILLYVESVRDASRFLRAASMASNKKPIVAIKSGRVLAAQKAAASHTGAMAGADDVYEAAFRQAGILRVSSIEDLFGAVETLGKAKPLHGDGLTIFSNGGGPGVMATDCLVMKGGRLAKLSDTSISRLDSFLPVHWSHGNPVDLIGDAPPERYRDALGVLLDDEDSAALLFINAPSAIVPSLAIAEAMVEEIRAASKTVFACWLGREGVKDARNLFSEKGIPCFDTPEDAVSAFIDMIRYRKSQWYVEEEAKHEKTAEFDRERIVALFAEVRSDGRELLSEIESKRLLELAGLPIAVSRLAKDAGECVAMAEQIGFPIVLKIVSPDISHKSDVGGVALNLESVEAVLEAAKSMQQRVRAIRPDATLTGFSVQQMIKMPSAHELIVGSTKDPVFGQVVLFGHGGTAVEVIGDRAIALPPLSESVARDLIGQTRVSKLLAGYRDRPKANIESICEVLIRISELVTAFPEIEELDINPLFANESGVRAVDARVRIGGRIGDLGCGE